jgi:hypothetical protein
MTKTPYDGRPFKVISEATGTLMAEADRLQDAQAAADQLHHDDPATHFRVVEIRWCGGSKRLSDIKTG